MNIALVRKSLIKSIVMYIGMIMFGGASDDENFIRASETCSKFGET